MVDSEEEAMPAGVRTIRIRDEEHSLSREDVVAVARSENPRRINAYFVEIDGLRFPPKQLIRSATRSTKAFDTAVAIRALKELGFAVEKSSSGK
jgi:hypothetical protein